MSSGAICDAIFLAVTVPPTVVWVCGVLGMIWCAVTGSADAHYVE